MMNLPSILRKKSNQQESSWQFWIIAGYFAITAVFILCWSLFFVLPVNQQIVKQQSDNLTLTAQACAKAIPSLDNAQEFATAAAGNTELRITLISNDGKVLADSNLDPTQLENHLQREEVQEALAGEIGIAQRDSVSDGIEQIYVAMLCEYQSESAILRVSEPLSAARMVDESLRNAGIILVCTGVLLILIIAFIALRQSSTPFRKLERVRTDFVANASHELKTPVAGIRLLSEAINDAAEMNDKKNLALFTERLDHETERLQRLVIDLLDLSRLESQENTDQNPHVDLHSTLITSYITHKVEAENKGLQITLLDSSKTNDDCYAAIEPSDASLIFDNLIENAIMYTDQGSITVRFEVNPREIVVVVEDTGIGIPQADQSRIFERFYRVDKARSREVGGTGLGLSLVRHAVERSHGTIKLKSEPGVGTRFTVTLPKHSPIRK